jgi:DHA1 family tetracycline resistance protein-like MFS transporter
VADSSDSQGIAARPRGLLGRPAALPFVYAAILMNVLSMGIIIPVFPTLLRQVAGAGDAQAATIAGWFGAAWSLMQLIFAPWFGAISDRFGRRPVLLVSMFGLAIDYVIMALAPTLLWLFIGRVISGITSASGSAAGAYVADVSSPEDRARNFGRFQAAANAGIVLGPAIGGLLGHFDPRAPFWVAAALALANGLYGLVAVPESLSHERRAPFRWASANAVGSVRLLASYPGLFGLAAVSFLFILASMSFNSIFQFYTHFRFGWGPPQVAALLIALGVGNIVVQSTLSGVTSRLLGDRGAVIGGLMVAIVGYVILGLAAVPALFWAGAMVLCFANVSGPANMSLMSKRVAVDEQGRLQGALSIFLGMSGLIGPIVFTRLFSWAVGPAGAAAHAPPGLPILVGAGFLVLSLAAAFAFAREPREPEAHAPS